MGKITGPYGPSDWNSAKAFCEELGQTLMTIDSEEEETNFNKSFNAADR